MKDFLTKAPDNTIPFMDVQISELKLYDENVGTISLDSDGTLWVRVNEKIL